MRARRGIVCAGVLGLLACAAGALAAPASLDKSFGDRGRAFAAFPGGSASANAMAFDRKGRIVTAGQIDVAAGEENFAVARFKPNGSLDDAFSGDGEKTLDFGGGGDDEAHAVAVDRKGRILVAGTGQPGTFANFGIARFRPNGKLDPKFGDHGVAAIPIRSANSNANAMALDSKGRIVVGGDSEGPTTSDFALARLKPNGEPDHSFGGDGKVTTPIGGGSFLDSLAIDKSGRIVALGAGFGSNFDFALARYKPNGKLDHSFSGDGKLTTDFLASDDIARSVAIDRKGRIVAVGSASNGSNDDFAVARYKPNGKLDHSFGGDGKVTTKLLETDVAFGAAIDHANRIVAAGITGSLTEEFGLVRYRPNGKLDPKFGHHGRKVVGFGDSGAAESVAIDRKDRIVAAGGATTGVDDGVALIRLKG